PGASTPSSLLTRTRLRSPPERCQWPSESRIPCRNHRLNEPCKHTGFATSAESASPCKRPQAAENQGSPRQPGKPRLSRSDEDAMVCALLLRHRSNTMKSVRRHNQDGTHSPGVAAADRDLFRDAIGSVRELNLEVDPPPSIKRPQPRARQFELDEAAVRDELLNHPFDPGSIELGDEILYLKPGQPTRLLKQLR